MKRIFLFVVTNLAVMLVLGIAANVLGLNRFLTESGLNLGTLLGFAAVMGFGGAIISLLISKPMAKWSTGAQVINDSPDATHQWIVTTVKRFADKAGIQMPEVAIYEGQAREMGKPPAAWSKIVEGKLEKFYQESCLLEQSFIKDPAVTIKDLLALKISKIGENMNVSRFTRYQLGEA